MKRWKGADSIPPDWEPWYLVPVGAGGDPDDESKLIVVSREEHMELVPFWNSVLAACTHDRVIEPRVIAAMNPPEPWPDLGFWGGIRRGIRRMRKRREARKSAVRERVLESK
jgi:hypothetical protein